VRAVRRAKPDNADATLAVAGIYATSADAARRDEARALFAKYADARPLDCNAWLRLATLCEEAGDTLTALNACAAPRAHARAAQLTHVRARRYIRVAQLYKKHRRADVNGTPVRVRRLLRCLHVVCVRVLTLCVCARTGKGEFDDKRVGSSRHDGTARQHHGTRLSVTTASARTPVS
jgi:hypothetical protein